MRSASLLDDRYGSPDPATSFEIAQEHDCVRQVSDIDWGLHVAHQAVLRHGEESAYALAVEVLREFVEMKLQRRSPGIEA